MRSETVTSACPSCGVVAERRVYDIGSGPELSCADCEWCWGAEGQSLRPPLMTRRQYLTMKVIQEGTNILTAVEVVASTALAHPEWDMDEERTWDEWQRG